MYLAGILAQAATVYRLHIIAVWNVVSEINCTDYYLTENSRMLLCHQTDQMT